MGATETAELGQRLEEERARRFVGRTAELDLFVARLAAATAAAGPAGSEAPRFSVLWVHGPGGIGKSALLAAYDRAARTAGFAVAQVDGRRTRPTATGFRSAVHATVAPASPERAPHRVTYLRTGVRLGHRQVILCDAVERLESVQDWLREEFLPSLPAETVVVIAGRRPPDPDWRSDPGWRDLLRTVPLRNLSADQTRDLLEIEGLPATLLEQVMGLTHGHPLTLALLIDTVRRSAHPTTVPDALRELPDLVTSLLNRLIDHAPTSRHRAALQVSAHAPITTEPVLRAALDTADADEVANLWTWLQDLSLMEETRTGLRLHEVARDLVEADLRRRDPTMYADIHRRLRAYLIDQLCAARDNPRALQRAVADLLFLVRDHPVAGAGWDREALHEQPGEELVGLKGDLAGDIGDQLITLTRQQQGAEQADLVAHWLRVQPHAFRVFRDADGELAGFAARLAVHLADPADIAADPGTAALVEYVARHAPPRPGEQVLAWRFLVDRDPDERHPRLAASRFGAWHIADILVRPPTAWDFIATYTDLDHWEPFFTHWDFAHVAEADFRIGDRRYAVFAHDWRRIGAEQWLERTAARELGEQVGESLPQPAAVLSPEEFADSVKQALRSLHQPTALVRSPLLTSQMVQQHLRADPEASPDQVLRSLLLDAAAALKADPRAEDQYRVLHHTYLRPAPTQEKAAEMLDLPYTTYRRYRNRALESITSWLWERDLDSGS
jgi:hypothetical protein